MNVRYLHSFLRSLMFVSVIIPGILSAAAQFEREYELTVSSVLPRFESSPYVTEDWISEIGQLNTVDNKLDIVLPLWGANALAYPNEVRSLRWSFRSDYLGMVFIDKQGRESIASLDINAQQINILVPAGYTHISPISWSQDSRRITFSAVGSDGIEQVMLLSLPGLEIEAIAEGKLPTFSPESDRIAFLAPNDGVMLYTLEDKSEERQIPLEFPQATGLVWSGDGQAIAVTHAANITTFDLETRIPHRIFDAFDYLAVEFQSGAATVRTYSASWSPDNQQIAFVLNVRDEIVLGNVSQVLSVDITSGEVTEHLRRSFPFDPAEPSPADPRLFLSVSYQARGAFIPSRDDDTSSDI
ncbi:MAG TPA: hypothetical protein VJZ27_05940 [Aggregatilineales bacterium]|nr:hypothetical protein [Aggregatilineales bacterium]